jgi:hypothetical protein
MAQLCGPPYENTISFFTPLENAGSQPAAAHNRGWHNQTVFMRNVFTVRWVAPVFVRSFSLLHAISSLSSTSPAHLERPTSLLPLWPASISAIVTTCHSNRVEESCPLQLLRTVEREVCLHLSTPFPQPLYVLVLKDPSSSCPHRGARRQKQQWKHRLYYQNSLMVYTICPFSDGLYDLSVFGFCNESSNPRAILCISLHDAYLNPTPRFFVLVGVALVGGSGTGGGGRRKVSNRATSATPLVREVMTLALLHGVPLSLLSLATLRGGPSPNDSCARRTPRVCL